MKILFIGQCLPYQKDLSSSHCVEGRDLELSKALVKLGHEVDLVSSTSSILEGLALVNWEDVSKKEYDGIIICSIEGHWNLRGYYPKQDPKPDEFRNKVYNYVLKHPRVVANLDAIYPGSEELTYVKASGMLTALLVNKQQALHVNQKVFYLPLGCPEVKICKDPFPTCEKDFRVIYVGRVSNHRVLRALNCLADIGKDSYELWLASTFQLDGPQSRGLTGIQRRDWVSSNIKFCSDLLDPISVDRPYGPVRYYDTHKFLYHSSVGVSISASPDMELMHSKITEYLGAGCRVVSDEGPPNNGDIITLKAGQIVKWEAWEDMYKAILVEGNKKQHDRSKLQQAAQALSSWETCARLLLYYL